MAGKHFQAGLGVFVEPLKQGYGQRVFYRKHLCAVVDRVAAIAHVVVVGVVSVCVVILGRLVCLVYPVVPVYVGCMYETCHRHKLTFHGCVDRVLPLLGGQQTVHFLFGVYAEACGVYGH